MIVTHASAIASAPGSAAPAPTGPVVEAIRRLLLEPGAGRVVLRVAASAALPPPRWRALRLVLQDAADASGGQFLETTAGELLLLGTTPGAAARVMAVLHSLAATAPTLVTCWDLPEEAAPLLAWAGTARLAGPAAAARPTVTLLPELDAQLQSLPLERVVRRRPLLRLRRGTPPALAAQALEIPAGLLAAEMGSLSGDADLLAHAMDVVAARLPGRLAAFGLAPGTPLMLPLPREGQGHPGPAPRPGMVAVLGLAAAGDPHRLAEQRAALAADGWRLALAGLDAAALRLLAPAALPADLLLLRWSPALAEADASLLAALDPASLVLDACDMVDALSWGAARGISTFAGPHIDALLAAMRIASCPAAGACDQRLCTTRAAAIAAADRAGCGNPALLAALLPELPSP